MEASGDSRESVNLILAWDPDLIEIIGLSLRVTLTAVALACVIGLPLGALVGAFSFPGRTAATVVLNALMGLPPVVVGLIVYLILSAAGPARSAGPALHAGGNGHCADGSRHSDRCRADPAGRGGSAPRVCEQFASLQVGPFDRIVALLWDARYSLLTVALAGFGRAVSEVGAIIIVGGNINHVTRMMTTTIALETSKGNLQLALALGVVLLAMAVMINAGVMALRASAVRSAYA